MSEKDNKIIAAIRAALDIIADDIGSFNPDLGYGLFKVGFQLSPKIQHCLEWLPGPDGGNASCPYCHKAKSDGVHEYYCIFS